jgi:hypothetical protein
MMEEYSTRKRKTSVKVNYKC